MVVRTTEVTRCAAYLVARQKVGAQTEASVRLSCQPECSLKVTMCDTRDEVRYGSPTSARVRPPILAPTARPQIVVFVKDFGAGDPT